MSPSRRTALLGCGVGLAGAVGLGYRHRRRLRRRSDLEPIGRALETEPPAVDPGPPVSLEHLEARFTCVEDAVDEAEAARDESLETHRTDYRELPPSALENVTHAERRSALETYRYTLGVAYHTTASERYERESGGDPGALEDRLEDERERLAGLEDEYRGDSALEEVPGREDRDETGWTVDAGAVVDRKETAIETISRVLEKRGADPLGERLLATASRIAEEGDGELEALPADVNELSNDEWNAAVELAWLYYREAAAFADAIPDTLALVTE
jgi:hypothetical protein